MSNKPVKIQDAVVCEKYTDRQTGHEKKKYTNIGTLFFYADGGMSLKLVGGTNISFYDRKPRGQQGGGQGYQQQPRQAAPQQYQPQANPQAGYQQAPGAPQAAPQQPGMNTPIPGFDDVPY